MVVWLCQVSRTMTLDSRRYPVGPEGKVPWQKWHDDRVTETYLRYLANYVGGGWIV
jgi:hypothetical protein